MAKKLLFNIAKKQNVSLESRRNTLAPGRSPKLKSIQPTLVGIHVRRGDKVDSEYILPGKDYFTRAMDHFKRKYKHTYFIVVSEDKKWGQKNVIGDDILHSTSSSDLIELTLLSLCDHTIMSVGTFGWWAAYLAGGDVVYYRDHVPKNSELSSFYYNSRYFLPHWIPLL